MIMPLKKAKFELLWLLEHLQQAGIVSSCFCVWINEQEIVEPFSLNVRLEAGS